MGTSNQLNELMETDLPPLSPCISLDMQRLLTSLDQEATKSQDLLVQSETESRFLSPRSSGCVLSPTISRSKVSSARDSMKILKNRRSNSRNSQNEHKRKFWPKMNPPKRTQTL